MAESIESFVAKLQTEGVEAGERQAGKLRAEAESQARKVLNEAKAEAEKIVADAQAEAKQVGERAGTELALAARDAVLRLRESLTAALQAVLAAGVEERLADEDFLTEALHELICLYAQADVEGVGTITINVSPELRDKIVHWALEEVAAAAKERTPHLDLKGSLASAGFEYNISGATVEVTVESVVEVVSGLVGSKLAELVEKAVAETKN